MKTVILGGTFNPPHIGHFFIADMLLTEYGYDRILFVPSNLPAHKDAPEGTSPGDRIAMLKAETVRDSRMVLDDCEIRRGGVSYSIETIADVKKRYSDLSGKPGLVIGDDLVEGFHSWKNWEMLPREADILIVHRKYAQQIEVTFPHQYLQNILIPVSSTDIRSRISGGKAFRYLVPETVYTYIMTKRLYGN